MGADANRAEAWRGVVGVLVVSALLTAFSESFYWYPGGTDFPFRMVVYVVPTTALLWALSSLSSAGWAPVVLAGAFYGFVTEGVLTPVVYGGYPLDVFAISYTSLAWHALVSVGFGLFVLHRVLVRGSPWLAFGTIAACGVFWGLWALGLRLPPESDEEVSALPALVGDVGVGTFALYTVAVTAMVALVHLLLGRTVTAAHLRPSRGWCVGVCIAGAVWFAVLVVPAVPWAPLELAALLFVCRWGLRRLSRRPVPVGSERPAADLLAAVTDKIPPARLALLTALPVAATATYAILVGASLDDQTIRLLSRDAVVLTQTVAGWAVFGWALLVARRSGALRTADGTAGHAESPA